MINKNEKIEKEKEFDTVETFREIKKKISSDLVEKSTEQILEYLRLNSLKLESEK